MRYLVSLGLGTRHSYEQCPPQVRLSTQTVRWTASLLYANLAAGTEGNFTLCRGSGLPGIRCDRSLEGRLLGRAGVIRTELISPLLSAPPAHLASCFSFHPLGSTRCSTPGRGRLANSLRSAVQA